MQEFYPETDIIVADGSKPEFQSRNRKTIQELKQNKTTNIIDYRPFDYEIAFHDRILTVLREESDDFFVMGADDDFPLMDTLNSAESFLLKHSDYCTALGPTIKLTLKPLNRLFAHIDFARPITAKAADHRATEYAQWSFPTTYALTRREVLIERYERVRKHFLAGFVDFMIGIHDCMFGKLHAFPDLAYIRTAHYNHSYLRPDSQLIFLHRQEETRKLMTLIQQDLITYAHIDTKNAARVCDEIFKERIAELCGRPRYIMDDFVTSDLFNNKYIQQQYTLFQDIFEQEKSSQRLLYLDKLNFISTAMQTSLDSDDNKGEDSRIETLQQQATL